MAYVAMKALKIGIETVRRGTEIPAATVDSWHTRDASLNNGSIRSVDDAQVELFIADLKAGRANFHEEVARQDRSLQMHRIAHKKEVR